MIDRMTRYSFILLSGEQDAFLDKLQEIGLVDITRSVKPVDDSTRELLERAGKLHTLADAIMKADVPSEAVKQPCSVADAETVLLNFVDAKLAVDEAREDYNARLPWGDFDAEKLFGTGIPVHFHVLSPKAFKPEWAESHALVEVARDKSSVRFVVMGDDTLPGEVPALPASYSEAAEREAAARAKWLAVGGRILGLRDRILELQAQEKECMTLLDVRLASAAAVPEAENTIVTLTGFAPTSEDKRVQEALAPLDVFWFASKAVVQENPPIRFKNNKFVRMFETLTDMYGRPSYDGFDPTPFISVFFLLFFAFCMGDAGYGLVLMLVGLLLKKKLKDLAPLVVTLGAATVVIGFLFHTFFSIDISQWAVFEPIKGVFLPAQIAGNDATMVLSLVVGILHISLAMVVKTIHETKTKGFFASLGTWGWTLLIVGGITVAAFALAGVLDATLTKWIVIALGVVSALGIFVFNDPKRNKFANVGMGLWDTYNMITGLVGDVLSYIRLYALGLAGSMLGMAFNDMGVMILGDSPNIAKWLGFLLLVIFGHTLNIAMCALGAFVHPLRLNFLEFFKNAGYEATGRSYNPLKKQ